MTEAEFNQHTTNPDADIPTLTAIFPLIGDWYAKWVMAYGHIDKTAMIQTVNAADPDAETGRRGYFTFNYVVWQWFRHDTDHADAFHPCPVTLTQTARSPRPAFPDRSPT